MDFKATLKRRKTGGRDIKPGQVLNPHGRPRLPAEVKESRALNHVTVPLIIDRYMKMGVQELQDVMKDPKTPAMELILAKVIVEAIRKGDQQRLSFLFDRLLGKQQENISVSGNMHMGVMGIIKKLNDNR